jgi:hypothetical protein
MRLIAFVTLAFVAGGPAFAAGEPAAAQSWKEYAYPDYAFAVSFPAEPKTETTAYQAADGRAVPAHVYSVTEPGSMFRMTIVELADTGLEESAVIDQAIKTLSQGGEIKLNIPARVSRVFGRQLSILGGDGSRSSVALFYHDGRLYQIEGRSQPPGNATSDAIRFQQSLIFTEASNGAPRERGPGDRQRRDRGGPEGAAARGTAPALGSPAAARPN